MIFISKKKSLVKLILLAFLFFILGFFVHTQLAEKNLSEQARNHGTNFELFWEVWDSLKEKYPFDEPDSAQKMYGAIRGLARSYGDDYTNFLPPDESLFFNENVSGEFGGIGAEISLNNGLLVIVAPLKGSPAERSGLKAGDVIIKVNSIDVLGMTLDEAISLIRGERGTELTLSVIREGEEQAQEISLMRDTVVIPTLDTEIIDEVFVIHLYNFNESSNTDFKKALEEFLESGKSKLILDLRNNPGGYLNSALDISSYFLEQGKLIVSEDFGRISDESLNYRSYGYGLLNGLDYELAILINYGSASASEIVAAALSEYDKATIIGEPSYGKGSVQELISLSEGSSLKLTVAKWLTPKGEHIDKKGVQPDILVKDVVSEEEDDQILKEALIYLNKESAR